MSGLQYADNIVARCENVTMPFCRCVVDIIVVLDGFNFSAVDRRSEEDVRQLSTSASRNYTTGETRGPDYPMKATAVFSASALHTHGIKQ